MFHSVFLILSFASALFMCGTVRAATQTITFDEPPVDTKLSVRYANLGVVIRSPGPELLSLPSGLFPHSNPYSGPNVLISLAHEKEHDPDPLILEFTYKQEIVSFFTGISWESTGTPISLRAFDENGQVVASDTATIVGPSNIDHKMEVNVQPHGPIITKIEIKAEGAEGFEVIDDLTLLTEESPPPPAEEPPQVVIDHPPNNDQIPDGAIVLAGHIYGDGLFPEPDQAPPTYTITFPTNPQTAGVSPVQQPLILGGTLQGMPPYDQLLFVAPLKLTDFGINIIRVEAYNAAGTGSDEVNITYLPDDIDNEYSKSPSAFGQLIWGTTVGKCTVAIYQLGAIFTTSGMTIPVTGDIYLKWQSLTTPSKPLGRLGCPRDKEKMIAISPGAVAQDFEGGRIYCNPVQKACYYVVEPFVSAIDELDFTSKFGLPVTDPAEQTVSHLPKLWQKFARNVANAVFVSSMEVTDNPLQLWVATPDLDGAQRVGLALTDVSGRIPTVWRSFTCTAMGMPCNVLAATAVPKTPYASLASACNNKYFYGPLPEILTVLTGPAAAALVANSNSSQWGPILKGKQITPFTGTVQASYLSNEDYWGNHECSGFLALQGVDWLIDVVPEVGHEHLLGDSDKKLIIEYEWCLAPYPYSKEMGSPLTKKPPLIKTGDRMFLAGRWISDCGCHPFATCDEGYHAEIHPPAVMINMYTGHEFGNPITVGDLIYFDWWYPGESVQVDIFPPPRPEADAELAVGIPVWETDMTAVGTESGIKDTLMPNQAPNHVRLQISGRKDAKNPPQEDSDGQLHYGCFEPLVGGSSCPAKELVEWGVITLRWVSP
jgi:hypothetical protein